MDPLIFDGHNDALSRLWCAGGDPVAEFQSDIGHVNLPACRRGGMGGGFYALYAPTRRKPFDLSLFRGGNLSLPLPEPLDQAAALQAIVAQAGIARQLHDAEHLTLCTDARTLGIAFADPARQAAVLHLEGADCIDRDLFALDALHALGLRSIGPVWSRPTIFGEGVPFRHGSSDTGGGLTDDGQRLVARCKELGLIVDTSHMTMRGFWDIGEAGLPLVATHSNASALCDTTRNLTDAQLRAVGETGGMVGLNFGAMFLSEEAWQTGRAPLEDCVRQLAHMIDVAGEAHVGLGSDFDGAPMPDGITSAADLGALVGAMRAAGFGEALIARLCNENWLDFLSRHLGGADTE